MHPEDDLLLRRLQDLADLAQRSWSYTYSGFLSLAEQDAFLTRLSRSLPQPWTFFGGTADCERRVLRFGESDEDEPFPIRCLRVFPRNAKFAESLTHRDFLGALLNLGVDRSCVGDIVVREKEAFVFVLQHMAPFLCNQLEQVRRTPVRVEETSALPEGALYRLESVSLLVSSPRADGVIAHAYGLSRNQAQDLFRRERVFVNGRAAGGPSYELKEDDLVSVRGFGRFFYRGVGGQSRKGRLYVEIQRFV